MDDEKILSHHGVRGQKWGVRRSAAQLGHPTSSRSRKRSAGQASNSKSGKFKIKLGKRKSKSSSKASTKKTKSVHDMTDEELQSAINRKELERKYMAYNSPQKSKGKKFVETVGNKIVAPVAIDLGKQLLSSYTSKALNEKLDLKGEYKVYANNKRK